MKRCRKYSCAHFNTAHNVPHFCGTNLPTAFSIYYKNKETRNKQIKQLFEKEKKMLKAGRDFSIFKQLIRPCFWVCSMLSQKESCAVYCFYVFRFHFVLLTANFLLFMNTDGEGQMSEMSLPWINLRSSPVYIYILRHHNKQSCQTDVSARLRWENCLFFGPQVTALTALLVQFVLQCGKTATCAPWPIISSWISPSLTCWSPSSACRLVWW